MFYRERAAGMYSAGPYAIAQVLFADSLTILNGVEYWKCLFLSETIPRAFLGKRWSVSSVGTNSRTLRGLPFAGLDRDSICFRPDYAILPHHLFNDWLGMDSC